MHGYLFSAAATRRSEEPLSRLTCCLGNALGTSASMDCRAIGADDAILTPAAAKRPRGYSCEEIGGIGFACEEDFPEIISFSEDFPAFISPHGTGCSRYVSTLQTNEGILATWQQSQKDESQPLVANFLSNDKILKIFSS